MPIGPSASFLTSTVTVLRAPSVEAGISNSFAVDDAAGRAASEAPVAVTSLTELPCSIQPDPDGSGAFQLYGQRVLGVDTCIYFGQALAVKADDVVQDDSTGVKYIVLAAGDEAEQGRVSWILARRLR